MLSSRKVNVHDSDMNKLMAGSVQINKKATVLCIIGLAVVLYLLYSWRRTSVSDVVVDSVSSVSNNAWDSLPNQLPVPAEHQSLVDIPKDILNSQKEVRIKEEYLTFTLGDTVTKQSQKVTVFYQEAAPLHKRKTECSVLLLHGAKFTSQNWHEMNTLQLIAACGCRAVAVDLPGWGKSIKDVTKQSLDSRDKPVFLERLIATLELGKPVLVSPSMSGSFAIPFLMGDKPAQCGSRLKAFIALAPVQTETYEHSMYHRCEIPAMIVSGTKDMSIGRESLGNLRNMPSRLRTKTRHRFPDAKLTCAPQTSICSSSFVGCSRIRQKATRAEGILQYRDEHIRMIMAHTCTTSIQWLQTAIDNQTCLQDTASKASGERSRAFTVLAVGLFHGTIVGMKTEC